MDCWEDFGEGYVLAKIDLPYPLPLPVDDRVSFMEFLPYDIWVYDFVFGLLVSFFSWKYCDVNALSTRLGRCVYVNYGTYLCA
jgi:hypothetical protein